MTRLFVPVQRPLKNILETMSNIDRRVGIATRMMVCSRLIGGHNVRY